MNEQELINKYQSRLFNKLFSTLPIIRKFNKTTNKLNLDEPLTHYYAFGNKKFWFSKGEKGNKFIFIFCIKNKALKYIKQDDATLIIDFDKDKQFNNTSLGLFSISNSKIHVLINYDILKKRYPYFNTGDFKITNFKSIDNQLKLNVIDLGNLDGDFLENLEKLIKLSSALEILDDNEIENSDKKIIKRTGIPKSQQCYICLKDKEKIKINSNLNNLKNLKPELCGKCIEKIVASEFYTQLTPLLKGNETKDLNIAKEKFGNAEIFDIGLKLLEKYNILKYIGVKKLFFTLDTNPYLVSKYMKYSDENNLLIDKIIPPKALKTKKQEKIDNRTTTLTRETTQKMNLFLNALNAGKTHEKACKIAKIDSNKVEIWYNFGKKGDVNYIPFYNKYKPFKPENKERNEKMEKFLDALKNEGNIDFALKVSDLDIDKVRAWYGLGEKGDDDYKDFYLTCNTILPKGIPKKETKKIVNNDELMNEFIALIDSGKTNNEAINQLKIPKFKVKNWVNQGKLGNKKYVNFYNTYMIEIEKEKELKKSKTKNKPKTYDVSRSNMQKRSEIFKEQLEKEFKKYNAENEISKEIKVDLYSTKISDYDEKTCKLCGRKLNNKTKKDICKRCLRKQYAAKIVLKLLRSIEPEKPFRKEDLKVLGLQNIQIRDYIWTLQEYNLITEQNNKLQLKSRTELEKFIKESGLEIDEIPHGQGSTKLNKTCKTCGETLEISKFFTSETAADGYEDNCKDCKRLISAANYLKEIIEFVDYDSEFSEDELKPHFKNSFQLQAKIWALLDNDLLRKNFENNTYILTDEKTATEFLDKYYEEKSENEIQKESSEESSNRNPKEPSKQNQMKLVLRAMNDGKSKKEAAELADIPLYKITHWFNEGQQGYGKENIIFYNQMKKIEENNEIKYKTLKNKMTLVLEELWAGKDISEVKNSTENEINQWIEKGKSDESPYVEFANEYKRLTQIIKNEKIYFFEKNEINRKKFLKNLDNGKSKEESAESADLNLTIIQEWYLKGKNNEEPYTEFYEEYQKIKNNDKPIEIPTLEKTDQFGSNIAVNQMNIILEALANGKNEKEAVNEANISENTYKYWLNRGKQGFGELYTQFYHYIKEIKSKNIHEIKPNPKTNIQEGQLEKILTPLPTEHISKFNPKMNNKTGIAWVSKLGTNWIYQRQKNGKQIRIIDSDIYKLHEKVIKNKQVWGITDYEKAKKIINIPNDFEIPQTQKSTENDEIKQINRDIYAPLPKEYLDTFPKQSNQTGIAWVNKIGNQFIYSRNVNGKTVKITDYNIENLHKKVINQNQIWGIRDYSNAGKFIDIPEEFKIPEIYRGEEEQINKDIYAPLPKEYISKFNPKMNNKTGIAWVNKYGLNWVYTRQKNGKQIKFSNPDIYRLHKKVIENKQVWGIIDYEKAKKIIEPNDEEITISPIPNTVTITYIERTINSIDVIIKGIIKNNELISVLNRLELFERNIKRINTTSINNEVDIFIELNISKYLLETFEEKIEDFNWKINK